MYHPQFCALNFSTFPNVSSLFEAEKSFLESSPGVSKALGSHLVVTELGQRFQILEPQNNVVHIWVRLVHNLIRPYQPFELRFRFVLHNHCWSARPIWRR